MALVACRIWSTRVVRSFPRQSGKLRPSCIGKSQLLKCSCGGRNQRLFTTSCATRDQLVYSYSHGLYPAPFIGETIGQRLDWATENFPDREAYVCCEDKTRATFAEFREEVDQLAAGFLALGLEKGDRVGMWGPNSREWVLTQFATARVGLIMVNINPAYQTSEAEYALKKVGCKALIMIDKHKTQDYYHMVTQIAHDLPKSQPGELYSNRLPELKIVAVCSQEHKKFSGCFSFQDLMLAGRAEHRQQVTDMQHVLQCDEPINIQYTSGTTGNPKGATLSHHNILNNSYFVGKILKYDEEHARVCIPVPLYHCFGMVLGSLCTVTHGVTAVYPSRGFDPGAVLASLQEERCTSLYGTPTMFIDVLNHPAFDKFDFSTMRTGVMGGSPCPIEVMKKILTKLHMPDVTICYGLTETSPVTTQSLTDDPVDLRVSTVGRAHPNVEAKVIDSEGQVVPVNSPGEVCFRGYNIMAGYWDDEEKTNSVIERSGWFHSGFYFIGPVINITNNGIYCRDLAEMDENGYIKIIGRIKDVVIRGGENVYPTEIEQFLYKHPKIQDVQVIGVPDARLGEEVCAWIKLHAGEESTAEEIKGFCKGQIAHYKIPRYIKFVDEYPLTVTGKVKKFVMREISKQELGL